ncbi:PLP-dependent aminotransferase family protein [Aquincola sp. S2]|uniref:PLP-dependent aminotransferase family protein n=1 Tax=Pseudaquabacterium terrae TaxID=2732868 RepID=A0ABX2EG40_9BURK|nr:PLP-dependent aminotransferase family protein [Aquabacterium terrae]NRF67595.1 PLP-dependent aminotransferase family protein [Aquabacterium terrae]
MPHDTRFRYEALAELIAALVRDGTLAPGARAPSLRDVARQQRTSLTTALQAYRLLEDRGILQARPQSGFYIAQASALPAPAPTRPRPQPTEVALSGLMLAMLEHASNPRYVPLGCAIPSPALLDSGKLDRMLARAARLKGAAHNTYSPPRGEAALRVEIARRALRWGQALAPDDIVITCGATEALALALSAVTQPGDTVAVESPTYFGALQVLRALRLKALELPTDAHSGIAPAALDAALRAQPIAACVLASCFNNPLGCTMPESNKRAVLALLAQHRVPLIEDDVYGDIHFGAERPRPFSALDDDGQTIYCGSFSKTLAPGYRIGWVASRRHLPRLLEAKFAATLAAPVLPQLALAEFLASGGYDHHLRRLRRLFADTLRRMAEGVAEAFPAGTRISQPAGGFVLWLELPKAVDTRVLFAQALEEGICFAPGVVFSAAGKYTHCLRLSGGHGWDARLQQGLRRLGALAGAYAASRRTAQ